MMRWITLSYHCCIPFFCCWYKPM